MWKYFEVIVIVILIILFITIVIITISSVIITIVTIIVSSCTVIILLLSGLSPYCSMVDVHEQVVVVDVNRQLKHQ